MNPQLNLDVSTAHYQQWQYIHDYLTFIKNCFSMLVFFKSHIINLEIFEQAASKQQQ